MEQLKIGTHDSITGEKGRGLLSFLVTPFSKTQGKTLQQQYDAGCRLFDLRVRKDKNGTWRGAHGLWTSKMDMYSILSTLNCMTDSVTITITYEGKDPDTDFLQQYYTWKRFFTNIRFGYCAVKYGKDSDGVKCKYDILDYGDVRVNAKQAFLPLDGRSWHTYIPIPWLWKKIYHNKPEFNTEYYQYVDFL